MISLILGNNEFDLEKLAGLTAYDGWGMPPVLRFTRKGAQQHGDSNAGYLLQPRFGNLVFRMRATQLGEMYGLRKRLLKLLAPKNHASLRFTLPYGMRQFDVIYAGDLSLPWSVDDWAAQKFIVTLKANDPTCYDPVEKAVNFGLAASDGWAIPWAIPWAIGDGRAVNFGLAASDGWEIPWAIPWAIGDGSLDDLQDVNYDGDFDSYPMIYLVGPITNPVITNETTGDKLDFTGTTIANGDVFTVDCRYGYKKVTDASGVDQSWRLTSDSDLATFSLVASEEGNNVLVNRIRVVGSGSSGVSNIILKYYTRYLGI